MPESYLKETKGTYYCGDRSLLNPKLWSAYNVTLSNAKLYYVINGEIIISENGSELKVKKGEMVLIPPHICHSFFLSDDKTAEKYWIHFDIAISGKSAFEGIKEIKKIFVDDPKYVKNLFENIISSAASSSLSEEMEVIGSIMLLLSYFMDRANFTKIKNSPDEIDFAIKYAENTEDNLTLEEFASSAHLCPNHFIRKFKERTGFTPMRYITVCKIEHAKLLLKTTNRTISEIMSEIGYSDASYFSKLFKANTGHSPRIFRKIYGAQK